MRNLLYTTKDFDKIKAAILNLGFESAGLFYFRKIYKTTSYNEYGIIAIHGEEWVDNEVVIEIEYPASETNISEEGIDTFATKATELINTANSMNADLAELIKYFKD